MVCHTFAEEVKSKLTFGYLVILSSWPFDLFYGKDDGDDDDDEVNHLIGEMYNFGLHVFCKAFDDFNP